jgi:hypothetical protein
MQSELSKLIETKTVAERSHEMSRISILKARSRSYFYNRLPRLPRNNPSLCDPIHTRGHGIYQLKYFRPFNIRLFKIARPDLVLSRAKYPCRRFCTRREGENVSIRRRLPRDMGDVENAR